MIRNKQLKKYRVLSLFSGGMGLDIGLESTGRFEIVACIEKEHVFCETIRSNIQAGRLSKDLKVIEGDISKLNPDTILKENGIEPNTIDVVIGGPPCQSFSTAGNRGTTQDPRGTLIWDFLRFIQYIKPKIFLMENVRGLLSAALKHRPIADRPNNGGSALVEDEQPGSVVRLFSKDLSNLNGIGYNLNIFEVNSVNYGAPQIRERVLFIGNCYGREIKFPEPTHCNPVGLNENSTQLNLINESSEKLPWKTLGDAIQSLIDKDPLILDFSPRKKGFLKMVPPGSNWRSLPDEIQKESMGKAWYAKGGRSGWWRRLSFDLPAPTLVTMPNHASTSLCHPIETRALSIKEYARIQEFPDEWEFCGTISKKYAQVGNAVPTRLGKVAGNVIACELDEILVSKRMPLKEATCEPKIIYLQSHIRTRQWFEKGKAQIRKSGTKNCDSQQKLSKTLLNLYYFKN